MTAEVLACKRAAKLAMEMGTDKVIIGIDSLEVVRTIVQLLDRGQAEEVSRKSRSNGCNNQRIKFTHLVAKKGHLTGATSTWLSVSHEKSKGI